MRKSPLREKIKALALAVGLFLCLVMPPAEARDESYFLAVYASYDFPVGVYLPFSENLYYPSKGWHDFPKFLQLARQQAAGKPLIIDIACHGMDYLMVLTMSGWDCASMGTIVNDIEKNLDIDNVTILIEACFSAQIYKRTIRDNKIRRFNLRAEDCDHVPSFPLYGIGETMGISNLVYRQYEDKFGDRVLDLRQFETASVGPKDTKGKSKEFKHVLDLWQKSRKFH